MARSSLIASESCVLTPIPSISALQNAWACMCILTAGSRSRYHRAHDSIRLHTPHTTSSTRNNTHNSSCSSTAYPSRARETTPGCTGRVPDLAMCPNDRCRRQLSEKRRQGAGPQARRGDSRGGYVGPCCTETEENEGTHVIDYQLDLAAWRGIRHDS